MKTLSAFFFFSCVLCLCGARSATAQSAFQNLDFEDSYIVSSRPTSYGFSTGTADVPGWTAHAGVGAINYSGGTTIPYNSQTLDSPGLSLEGTDYPIPAIDGSYSIFLQYPTMYYPYGTYPGSIGQSGQIPITAQSLTYWGSMGAVQVTFDGHELSFSPLSSTANYTIYGANISAYAGQTGELLFSGGGMIDNIEFSPTAIPEPSVLTLSALGTLLLTWRFLRQPRHQLL